MSYELSSKFVKIYLITILLLYHCTKATLADNKEESKDNNEYHVQDQFVFKNSNSIEDVVGYRFKRSLLESQPLSLAFVFDTTGSMSSELSQVKIEAIKILDSVIKNDESSIDNFLLVPFNDPGVGPVTKTRDSKVLRRALNDITVDGGGDCPEYSMTGIKIALEMSSPKSFIIVFTDATAKDYKFVDDVVDLIQTKKSRVIFLLTGNCTGSSLSEYQAYDKVAKEGLGEIFLLTKADITTILEYFKSMIEYKQVDLEFLIEPRGHDIPHEVPVDNTFTQITAQVNGPSAELTIMSPNGKNLTGTRLEKVAVNLPNVKVKIIENPEKGNYNMLTGSTGEHKLKVTGKSDVKFDVKFAIGDDRNSEVFETPFKNIANRIIIGVQGELNMSITDIEILDTSGEILYRTRLHLINDKDDFKTYDTESFRPPDYTFLIRVVGYDSDNNLVKRIIGDGFLPIIHESEKNEVKKYSELLIDYVNTQ